MDPACCSIAIDTRYETRRNKVKRKRLFFQRFKNKGAMVTFCKFKEPLTKAFLIL